MKREFIKNLLPDINDDALNAIMAEVGKDIETKNGTITSLTTEKDGLKAQLDDAKREIRSYKDMDVDGIKAKVQEWEQKYNADTQFQSTSPRGGRRLSRGRNVCSPVFQSTSPRGRRLGQ